MNWWTPYYERGQVTDYPATRVDKARQLTMGESDIHTVNYGHKLFATPLGIVWLQEILPHPSRNKAPEYEFSFIWQGYLYTRNLEGFPKQLNWAGLNLAAGEFAREVAADNGAEIMARIYSGKSLDERYRKAAEGGRVYGEEA